MHHFCLPPHIKDYDSCWIIQLQERRGQNQISLTQMLLMGHFSYISFFNKMWHEVVV